MEIERLVQLTYPGKNYPFMDHLKTEIFVNGIGDQEFKHAVCATPRPTFAETFSFTLAQETAKVISRPLKYKMCNIEAVVGDHSRSMEELKKAVRQVLADGRKHVFTIDTGAPQSIIRPDVVKGKCTFIECKTTHSYRRACHCLQ